MGTDLFSRRNDAKHIFECFCEVVSPETSQQKPWVVQKYPESFKDDDLLKQVALFAFPCETIRYSFSQFHHSNRNHPVVCF